MSPPRTPLVLGCCADGVPALPPGHKTMVLLSSLAGKARETVYAPIDVSQRALDDNVAIFDREQFGDGGGAVRVLPFQGVFETCLPESRAALPGTKTCATARAEPARTGPPPTADVPRQTCSWVRRSATTATLSRSSCSRWCGSR